jgi:hypothetical protein
MNPTNAQEPESELVRQTDEAVDQMKAANGPGYDDDYFMLRLYSSVDEQLANLKKRLAGKPPTEKEHVRLSITSLGDEAPHYGWNFMLKFSRPNHPILATMFRPECGDTITKTFGYDKYRLRELHFLVDTVTRDHVAEMLGIALRVIECNAYVHFPIDNETPHEMQYLNILPEHKEVRHRYWNTILMFMDIWVAMEN